MKRSVVNESGLYGAMCLAVSRVEAALTAPVGKRGLGTAYRLTNRYLLPGETHCRAEIATDTWMRVPTFEPYWGPVAIGQRSYEPEIHRLLAFLRDRLAGKDWAFLDCGANFGYWSAIVSGPEFECCKVAAVEANPSTCRQLRETALLNGNRFRVLNNAVTGCVGEQVFVADVAPRAHATARVTAAAERNGREGAYVLGITIDALLEQLRWQKADTLVIKLDVEGHETEALRGAAHVRTMIPEHIFIYEDHGSADDCGNTLGFWNEGYAVYYADAFGAITRMTSVEQVRSVKKNPIHGYNYAAVLPGTRLARALDHPNAPVPL